MSDKSNWEVLRETIGKIFDEIEEKSLENGSKVFHSLPYEDRLYLVAYISKVLHDHAKEGGTYRYLIYDRFGFDLDVYAVLQMAGLLDIHNLISGKLSRNEEVDND